MICRYLICFLLAFFLRSLAEAQTHKIDSLKAQVAAASGNEQKAAALVQLCNEKSSLSADSLYKYSLALQKLSETIPGVHYKILADYFITYSLVINGKEDSSLAITNHYTALLAHNEKEKGAYLLFLQLKGLIYYRTNKPKETVNTFYELLGQATLCNDTMFMLFAKRGISSSYLSNGQNGECLKLVHDAVRLISAPEQIRFGDAYGLLLVNAAISFLHLHQATASPLFADSCEYYAKRAIDIGHSCDNLFIICQGLIARGLILSYKKEITEAENSLKQGLELRKVIGDTLYIISDMSVLGSFYANTKQLKKGEAICRLGISLARRRKNFTPLLLLLYNALAENYKATGNYKQYGETVKLQMAMKDSLNKQNSADELANLQTKYDLQKQETTIVQQKLDLTQKNYWIYGSLLLLGFAVVLSYILFKNSRRKQKLRMEIMKRNSELAVKEAEEAERKRIAADLHDSLGAYAASIASNITHLSESETGNDHLVLHELHSNSQAIVAQLSDTIWVLKKDALLLTSISDRLKVFIQKVGPSYPGVTIDVEEEITNDYLLPPGQAFHLFQIIKEGVINALKHSRCTQIIIKIEALTDWTVSVSDNGAGMNRSLFTNEGGNGLQNMKERATESGWKIEWQANQPTGTKVVINATTN